MAVGKLEGTLKIQVFKGQNVIRFSWIVKGSKGTLLTAGFFIDKSFVCIIYTIV